MNAPASAPLRDHDAAPAPGDGAPFITAIHPADEMYRYIAAHLPRGQDPDAHYFASGAAMLDALDDLLWDLGIDLGEVESFLEFACGYGRFTRHLVRRLDPSRVTGSDLFRDAVAFQKATFGVDGFDSALAPAQLVIARRYEVVFVASLFSHLPEPVWGAWIAKLYDALADGGLLVFSTHGETSLPPGYVLPANGFLYCRSSESDIHSVDDYGTTYVSSAFVHEAVRQATGQPVLREKVKALFNLQDVFVVRNPDGAGGPRRPPAQRPAGWQASARAPVPGARSAGANADAQAYAVLRAYAEGLERTNAFFDPLHYLLMYPDVCASGLDPWRHYLEHGRKEGRMGAFVKRGLL